MLSKKNTDELEMKIYTDKENVVEKPEQGSQQAQDLGKSIHNFEENMARLHEILEHMDAGNLGLDEMIEEYKKGSQLLQECKEKLDKAQFVLQQLDLSSKDEKDMEISEQ